MTSSSQKRRDYQGPVFYSHGFRSFFLFAGIWAALAMLIWVLFLATGQSIPSDMTGVDWHMHEMVFGYAPAVIAGFLLTAVPNWTGRLPIMGWPTALLSGLWLLGRILIFFSSYLPQYIAPIIDSSFLIVLGAVIAREVIAGKNWRNLKVIIIVVLLALANVIFHIEASQGVAYQGTGVRLGVGILIMLIAIIGGRVIPSFTRNWLVRQKVGALPIPFNNFDRIVLVLSAPILVAWVFWPHIRLVGILTLLVGVLHLVRLWRWQGVRTLHEPLVWVLHAGYLFLPLGFITLGLSGIFSDFGGVTRIPHAWMVGAVGTVTLAMMTRASLGHSGRPLEATWSITTVYGLVILATLLRMWAEFEPASMMLLHMSATAWILGFGGFAIIYFPILTRPRI